MAVVLTAILRLEAEIQELRAHVERLAQEPAGIDPEYHEFLERMLRRDEDNRILRQAVKRDIARWGVVALITGFGAVLWRTIVAYLKEPRS